MFRPLLLWVISKNVIKREYSGIQLRFDLGSVAQIDFVYAYLESMIDNFLSQGTDYTNVALGTLV